MPCPLALGAALVLLVAALAAVAIAGALAGKGRLQRSADLAALSAARSLRDDLSRRLAPARLPNGMANPAHLTRRLYLARARRAGEAAAAGKWSGGRGGSGSRSETARPRRL